MTIEAKKEVLECVECGTKAEVVIVTDTADEDKPELFNVPAGWYLTQCMLDPESDDLSWLVMCSNKCAMQFLATFDEEDEDEEESEEEEEAH